MKSTVFNEARVQLDADVMAWAMCRGSEQLVLLRKRGTSVLRWRVAHYRESTHTFYQTRRFTRIAPAWLVFTADVEVNCFWRFSHE